MNLYFYNLILNQVIIMIRIIAISGKAGSGKDVSASLLKEIYSNKSYQNVHIIAVADTLKQIIIDLFLLFFGIVLNLDILNKLKNNSNKINIPYPNDYLDDILFFDKFILVFLLYTAFSYYIQFYFSPFLYVLFVCYCITFKLKSFLLFSDKNELTMRTILQKVGDIMRNNLGKQVFIMGLYNKIETLHTINNENLVIIIPDCRMNEFNMIQKYGTMIFGDAIYFNQLYISRPSKDEHVLTTNEQNHHSEQVDLSDDCYYIANNSDIYALKCHLQSFYNHSDVISICSH